MSTNIDIMGLTERFVLQASQFPSLYIGRVVAQHKELYRVAAQEGDITAEISGKLRHNADKARDYPAVGDFVMLDRIDDEGGNAIIHHVLTRKSVFIRKSAGNAHNEQIVAANIDTVFICMALNSNFNLRRLERYLSIAWDSGALPVVVLTKSDLCDDIGSKLKDVNCVAIGADVIVTSTLTEEGVDAVAPYVQHGKTVAFIGSSGVGKSTLINRLVGKDLLATKQIRKDDKGRHTTTHRELFVLPSGGAVIDTPGMREIGIESADLSKSFSDIDTLAASCKFSDCAHDNEPGCAVQQAIQAGILDQARLNSYRKLKKEAKYNGLNSRQIESEKFGEMFKDFGGIKNGRKFIREKIKKR